jgi:hypothetical protein
MIRSVIAPNCNESYEIKLVLIKFASDNYKVIKLSDGSESSADVHGNKYKSVSCSYDTTAGP